MKDKTLIPVFDPRHPFHNIIFWDTQAKEYYNKSSGMYLSVDGVKFHGLPPAYATLSDVVMGPSNSIDIYGPQGTVVQIEHTADSFNVCLDDGTYLLNLELHDGRWQQTWPPQKYACEECNKLIKLINHKYKKQQREAEKIVYGQEGIGKTYLSNTFPKPADES